MSTSSTRNCSRFTRDNHLYRTDSTNTSVHNISYKQISSPISRIPSELLSMIFLHLSDKWPTTYGPIMAGQGGSSSSVVLGWATVSHVSHHWRAVSLEYSRLWSCLHLQSPKWTQLQLERTRNAPISLLVPGHLTESGRDILNVVLSSHLHRLQYLSVFLTDESLTHELADILSGVSAPQLESLTLRRSTPSTLDLGLHHPSSVTSSVSLLSKGAPRLRHLVLTSWNISWSSPVLAGLTSLSISSRFAEGVAASGTLSDLLDSLDRMPHLEKLTLAAPLPAFNVTRVGRIVELRHLRQLELRAECQNCETLLRHLAFPPSASVDLSCMGFRTPPPPVVTARMMSAIHSVRLRDQELTYPLLNISTGAQVFRNLEIFRFSAPVDHFVVNLEPGFADQTTCDVIWSVCFDGSDSSVETFLSLLPLENLRSVTLDSAVKVGVLEILSNLPSLRSMWLSNDNVYRFLAYMYKEDPVLHAQPLRDIGLPSLSEDHFCSNSFRSTITRFVGLTELGFEGIQYCHSIYDQIAGGVSAISEGQLLRFLGVRSMYMKPIHEMVFRECVDVTAEKLELLGRVVPYVGLVDYDA